MRKLLLLTLIFCTSGSLFGQWETLNNSAITARHHPVTFTLDNTAYLLSGTTVQSNPFGTDNFFRYNEENDNWVELNNFPGSARSFAYAVTYGGKAYFGFGANGTTYFDDLWEFNPENGEWNQLNSCPCRGRAHPAFVAHNGSLYMGLGNDVANLNDWWEYNISTDSWTQRPSLPGNPRHHPFHFQAGDYVYAGMGHAGINFYADWYRYDTENNSWLRMKDHPNGPRVAGQQFSYKGYGFVLSGDGDQHQNLTDGEFWKYLHEEDEWLRLPDHPGNAPDGRVGRWAPGSMVVNDHLYFFGGVNRSGSFIYSDMHRFDLTEVISSVQGEFTARELDIFPNPVGDVLYFSIPDEAVDTDFQMWVTDINGRVVMESRLNSNQIQVDHLPAGMYFLTLTTDGQFPYRSGFVVRR